MRASSQSIEDAVDDNPEILRTHLDHDHEQVVVVLLFRLLSLRLCGRLGRRGSLALIRKPALTSPRRFTEGGVYRVLGRDILIWLLDLAGFSVEGFAEAYRENNLRRGRGLSREGRT